METEQLINLRAQAAGEVPGSQEQGMDEGPQLPGGRDTASDSSGPWALFIVAQAETLHSPPSPPVSHCPLPRHNAKYITFVI